MILQYRGPDTGGADVDVPSTNAFVPDFAYQGTQERVCLHLGLAHRKRVY